MGVKLVPHIQGEHELSMFENVLLKKMSRTKGNDLTGPGEDCLMRSLMMYTAHCTYFM